MAAETENERTYLRTIAILQERVHSLERQMGKKIFQGKDEIMEAYSWSEYKFKQWVKAGLPVLIMGGTCYAHRDNIDEFFRLKTRVNSSSIPDENL